MTIPARVFRGYRQVRIAHGLLSVPGVMDSSKIVFALDTFGADVRRSSQVRQLTWEPSLPGISHWQAVSAWPQSSQVAVSSGIPLRIWHHGYNGYQLQDGLRESSGSTIFGCNGSLDSDVVSQLTAISSAQADFESLFCFCRSGVRCNRHDSIRSHIALGERSVV